MGEVVYYTVVYRLEGYKKAQEWWDEIHQQFLADDQPVQIMHVMCGDLIARQAEIAQLKRALAEIEYKADNLYEATKIAAEALK